VWHLVQSARLLLLLGIHYASNSVLCSEFRQYQKDFYNEIKNIRHDLMLHEYPEEFVDCVMKPLRSNGPTSDTIYKDTVIIPYVNGISEKFRRTGNRLNSRTIFKTKYTLCGMLMKTGPVSDVQQTKQCMCKWSLVTVADVTSAKQADL
jgi:hypothetical protein